MKLVRTIREKKAIVAEAFAAPGMVKATSRKHGVSPSNIHRWKKMITASEANQDLSSLTTGEIIQKPKKKTMHPGPASSLGPEAIKHLQAYFEENRQQGHVVSITTMAIELYREFPELANVNIEALYRRVKRFCEANNIVTRRVTHAAQNHVYNEGVIANWVHYVNKQIQMNRYTADCIVNYDQTNIYFDISSPFTLEKRGTKSVGMKTTGCSNRCTVILAVSLSGIKLPVFCIFKGENKDGRSRIVREFSDPAQGYPQSIIYCVQAKAWDDSETHMQWIEKVWWPFCDRQGGNYTYLINDEFKVHLQGKIVRHTQERGTEVEFIPGGYTGALQVLDKGINKPFKNHYRSQQLRWQVENEENAKPKRQDVARWIEAAWERVTVDSIRNTWESIGIKAWEAPLL